MTTQGNGICIRHPEQQRFDSVFARKDDRTLAPLGVHFYGEGGIGKTYLRKQILEPLLSFDYYMVSHWLDFEREDLNSASLPHKALLILRHELNRRYQISFYLFDLAYTHYYQVNTTTNEDACREEFDRWEISQTISELLKDGEEVAEKSKELRKALWAVLTNGAAVAVAGSNPFVLSLAGGATLFKLINFYRKYKAHKTVKKPKLTDEEINALETYARLEIHQLKELQRSLITFLALDIKRFLSNNVRKLIISLDTYENVFGSRSPRRSAGEKDRWVRQLMEELPMVFWLITDRENRQWLTLDGRPMEHIAQHKLLPFTVEETARFLDDHNVIDSEARDVLTNFCGGMPCLLADRVRLYSSLASDQPLNLKVQLSFQIRDYEVFRDYLLRHIADSEMQVLEVLAVPDEWTKQTFRRLVKAHVGHSFEECDRICKAYSFIHFQNGKYTMNSSLRTSFRALMDQNLLSRILSEL